MDAEGTPVHGRELQALLAWSALPGVGDHALLALLRRMREGRASLAELWEAPAADLAAFTPLQRRARAALEEERSQRWRAAGEAAAELRARGVEVLTPDDPEYPPALPALTTPAGPGGHHWPQLFGYGALSLLETTRGPGATAPPRVALVNSRAASPAALAATDALADALARRDITLVTSVSREAYRAAAVAAKRQAGTSVLVLDRGLAEACQNHWDREPVAAARVWDARFDPDLQLLLSPFGWKERVTPRSGRLRDALVFDLADAVVAVEVTAGGNMASECARAAERGIPVVRLALPGELERAAALPWAARLPWKGGDHAAERVLQVLPPRPALQESPVHFGWLREIGEFLARACAALTRGGGGNAPPAGVVAHPETGAFAGVAMRWRGLERSEGGAPSWYLAEFTGKGERPERLGLLLRKTAPQGLVAALVPSAWLIDAEHAAARHSWLSEARVVLAVQLPEPPHAVERPLAAVVLCRGAEPAPSTPVFQPNGPRMGRFLLRRYLAEVLEQLGGR